MDRDKIIKFYSNEIEKDRLELDLFKLEGIRTKEIISRYLSGENMRIADIGGGAGYYSFWLQEKGHHVSLVDLSPKNIELANQYSQDTGIQLANSQIGDATDLNFKEDQFDLVLLLGPLYHLVNKDDRLQALSEAKRILKPNGILLIAIISRYASLIDGFKRDLITDDNFEKLLINDLQTGIHLNETENPDYFTTAYFHTPSEIMGEIAESKLKFEKLIAIESFGWIADDFKAKSEDPSYMSKLRKIINMVETNIDIIAMSPHIMAIARKE
ncbi:MAG TPA: class I SAM-dependent methyltransferase [Flavitalea sp.]|nr:class I SAM-dependent methyltransferase [Flavitalea sp.]